MLKATVLLESGSYIALETTAFGGISVKFGNVDAAEPEAFLTEREAVFLAHTLYGMADPHQSDE